MLHFLLSCMLLNTHQSHGTERKEPSFPRERRLSVAPWCPWYNGLWDKQTREKQRTSLDGSNRILGASGIWMSGRETKGGSDSCTTKVPVERRKGGSDFHSEAARRHERIPVNEARCGQQAANQMALKEMDNEFF